MPEKSRAIDDLTVSTVKYVVGGIGGLAVASAVTLWRDFAGPVYDTLQRNVTKDRLLQITCLLFLVCLLLSIWVCLLYRERRKPLSERFKFDDYGGYYIDPKNGRAVCPSCLAEGKIVNMMDVGGNKMCNACRTACRGKG